MKRWYCQICGNGKLAPAQMHPLDKRRFCLSCSVNRPRLVERIRATSLERAKAKVAEMQLALEKRKAREVVAHVRGKDIECGASVPRPTARAVCTRPRGHKGMHNMGRFV